MDPVLDVACERVVSRTQSLMWRVREPSMDPVLDVSAREPSMDSVLDVCVREPIIGPLLDVRVREPINRPRP